MSEGKLTVSGREYHVQADVQKFVRTYPNGSKIGRFFEAAQKLFQTGSIGSVAKGVSQAFFPSATRLMQTPEQVLERLHHISEKELKNYPEAEIKQRFEQAMTEALVNTPSGQALQEMVGKEQVRALAEKQLQFTSLASLRREPSIMAALQKVEPILDVEVRNLGAAQAYLEALLGKDLSQAPYAATLDEAEYNPTGLTDNTDRAAAWILKASNSSNERDNFIALLREYTSNGKDLTNISVLKELHQRLVPDLGGREYRGPSIAGGALPSSITGVAMLEQHLEKLNQDDPQLGKQLLGAVIGYHGFIDGNGWMGRVLYALTELRAGQFAPLAVPTEKALHGLP
ncbi:hypothetical protein [Chitinimonas sp. BJB300]|uniref:hypothetical protein n=1 Tax=Chitinimonas sp. BJB300 TaxID=1559339 RepID=UPI0018EBF8D6|nr:hypothetical protein [Chitinimonas sp. BJB300]